jgi:hypothetical protein
MAAAGNKKPKQAKSGKHEKRVPGYAQEEAKHAMDEAPKKKK